MRWPRGRGGAAGRTGQRPRARRAPRSRLVGLPFDLGCRVWCFSNGRVEFNDHFIRPNYSTELSDLFGRIGGFDSRAVDPATLQFAGVVAGTGVLSIEGAINPTLDPISLDLKAKATGIELPGLTPLFGEIRRLPDRTRQAQRGRGLQDFERRQARGATTTSSSTSSTFGEKSDSPDATTLPVQLAVALLQDRYGVIDIDLPVSGSINDPQFSLGGLIIKVIVNLLTKVLTAPFALLSGGGGGPDLSVVEFAPGSAAIERQRAESDRSGCRRFGRSADAQAQRAGRGRRGE